MKNIYTSCLGFLLVVGLLFLGGCQASPPEDPSKRAFRINICEDPPTLDPREASDNVSGFVIRMLFEGLVRYNQQREIEPAVAESIEISEDGKTYTFRLRSTFWSNGDPVTAEDFEKSWKEGLSSNQFAGVYNLFCIKNAQLVKERKLPLNELGVRVLDSQTFVIELENANPYFLELLTTHYYYPTPQKYNAINSGWKDAQGKDFVCNGPFVMEKWHFGDSIRLKKNPLYWDAPSVKLPEILLMMLKEPRFELNMFDRGEIDWVGGPLSGISLDAIAALKKEGRLNSFPTRSVSTFILNTQKVPFTSAKMRKAFAYALDRKSIVTYLFQDEYLPALSLSPPGPGEISKELFKDHDVEAARRLFNEGLEELGLRKEELPPIVLSYNTAEGTSKTALAIQDQWRKAFNIVVVLENQEWQVYLDKVFSRDFMIARLGSVAITTNPLAILEKFTFETSPLNPSGWSSSEYRRCIEEAKKTSDKEQYAALMNEAERMLMEEMPVIPFFFRKNLYIKNPRLRDVLFDPCGQVDFRFAYFEEPVAMETSAEK